MVEILPAKSSGAIWAVMNLISALHGFFVGLRAWGLHVCRLHSDCVRRTARKSLC